MTEEITPPDGGPRAVIVVIASFLCNGLIFGFINTYSRLNVAILAIFKEVGVENALTKASLIGSLTIGTTFFLSMISGIVSDRIGIRLTTFIGGLIASSNVLIASFFTDHVYILMLTYGVLFGVGASLSYIPSLSIIGHYFKKHIGIANGFVTVGSSVFSVAMPYILDFLIKTFGLNQCLRIMGTVLTMLMLCSLAFKPLYESPSLKNRKDHTKPEPMFSNFVNLNIWKNKKYLIWVIAVPFSLSGYFIPYVHMAKFIEDNYRDQDSNLPMTCIAFTSGFGRILFGILSDRPGINSIVLQQISFVVIGTVTIIVPLANNYKLVVALALILGLFDGCFVSLVGPIAFKFCGPKGAGQAIGFLLGFSSIPLILGPPIAGWIHDQTSSYVVPFIIAGIPPILGASFMTLIHFVEAENEDEDFLKSSKLPESNPLTDVSFREESLPF